MFSNTLPPQKLDQARSDVTALRVITLLLVSQRPKGEQLRGQVKKEEFITT